MAVTNGQIADFLRRNATVLVVEGADRFKIKAYRRAAETIETIKDDAAELIASGADLKQLPGIGKAISATIEQIVSTRRLPQLEKLSASSNQDYSNWQPRPNLTPKR